MNNFIVLVANHKSGSLELGGVYREIHVGASGGGELSSRLSYDNGDNISEKNPRYCELTAQYWAWKNLKDVEYIGFCHYRRYFGVKLSGNNISDLLKNKDVIALKIHYSLPIYWEIVRYISIEHLTILLMVLKKKCPDYEGTVIKYLQGNVLYPKNMFICRKEIFDNYAEWLFDILFECEKYMRVIPYSRANRSLAYMGEYLMPIYMIHNKMRMKFVECTEKTNDFKNRTVKIKFGYILRDVVHCVSRFLTPQPRSIEQYYIEAVMTGFNQDKISV